MTFRSNTIYALEICTVVAILAGCGGQSQVPPTVSMPASATSDAQQDNSQYTLIDLGTFGGPDSTVSTAYITGPTEILNNQGTVVGFADTAAADPFPAFCFDGYVVSYLVPDCNLANAFESQNGTLTKLNGLAQDSAAATAINSNGEIAGIAENGETDPLDPGFPELRAVLWKGQQITNLGTFGGTESYVGGVNNRGEVSGAALNTTPDPYSFIGVFGQGNPNQTQTHAFVWKHGVMTDIGTLGGPDSGCCNTGGGAFINQRGQISGDSYTNDVPNYDSGIPTDHPFLWTPGKGMQDLGTLGGDEIATDEGLNDRGEVIGSMYLAGDQDHQPYLWDGKKLINLGTFGGPDGDTAAINNAGEVAGWGGTTSQCPGIEGGDAMAFLWRNGHKIKLGFLPQTDYSLPLWINSKTQVVGLAFDCGSSSGYGGAFLWEGGTIVDLNTLVPPSSALHLFAAYGINDRGEIAGFGSLASGEIHAFLLVPNSQNAHRNMSVTARSATIPRNVTPAEVAVFRAFLVHLHDHRRPLRRY